MDAQRNSYVRDDGVVMVEQSPGCFVSTTIKRKSNNGRLPEPSGTDQDRCFFYLRDAENGLLADEAVALRERDNGDGMPAVNQVAPVFSVFKKKGIAIWRGKRHTRLGKVANVHVLTPEAAEIFRTVYGRFPALEGRQ